jgi:hypothetical protein
MQPLHLAFTQPERGLQSIPLLLSLSPALPLLLAGQRLLEQRAASGRLLLRDGRQLSLEC